MPGSVSNSAEDRLSIQEILNRAFDRSTGKLNISTSGAGDVTGPAASTDNAIARFDGAGGKTLQNSAVLIADTTGVISGTEGITLSGTTSGTTAVVATAIAGTTTLTLPAATDTLVGKATTDTFTNKTFDANGTGNSISNIDVADLANGTDGELITWDAAGAPAVVAAGSSGEVLTSNGAGAAPTFQAAGSGASTALDNLAAVAINTSLISDTDVTDDLGSSSIRWNNAYSATLRTGDTDADTLLLQARDVDGSSWTTFATLTAANTPTMDLAAAVTIGGNAILDSTDIGGTVQAQGDVLDDLNTLGAPASDGQFIVATGAGAFAYESGATALTSIGGIGAATTDTLTNKTFDANGTGNSLSNVDVADLANGTDGELITWDAAGAPATVAAGTAAQVLTSNGAGATPTFQAVPASSGPSRSHLWMSKRFSDLNSSSPNGGCIAITGDGTVESRYVLESGTTSLKVYDTYTGFQNAMVPRTPQATRSSLTITPAVGSRVPDGSTDYFMAFAASKNVPYRYDADGQNETSCTFSGTPVVSAQRIGWDPENSYIYVQDGSDMAATTVRRYTFTATTLTHVDNITLDSAPGTGGNRTMWIGDNYLCIDDSAANTAIDIRRYGKDNGTQADDTAYAGIGQRGNAAVDSENNFYYPCESNSGTDGFLSWELMNVDTP